MINTNNNGGALIITTSANRRWDTIRNGPRSLSFKDWRKYKDTYDFKLNDKTDILERINTFLTTISVLKDIKNTATMYKHRGIIVKDMNKNILDEYWSNDRWKLYDSSFFENNIDELIEMSPWLSVNNRTLLFIPWNIHFILVRDFNYNINKGHVTFEPDNNSMTNSKSCILVDKVHYGTEPRSGFFGFWANNIDDLHNFLNCKWAVRNLIRAYIYFITEIKSIPRDKLYYDLYLESNKDNIIINKNEDDENYEYYENKMKLKTEEKDKLKYKSKLIEESLTNIEPEPQLDHEREYEILTRKRYNKLQLSR